MIAFFIRIPSRRKTAKIPISCGNSWQKTAIAVVMPVVMLTANAAPMAKPSEKLCSDADIINIHAFDLMSMPSFSWSWWFSRCVFVCECEWECEWECACALCLRLAPWLWPWECEDFLVVVVVVCSCSSFCCRWPLRKLVEHSPSFPFSVNSSLCSVLNSTCRCFVFLLKETFTFRKY